jgi:hypothetical protein
VKTLAGCLAPSALISDIILRMAPSGILSATKQTAYDNFWPKQFRVAPCEFWIVTRPYNVTTQLTTADDPSMTINQQYFPNDNPPFTAPYDTDGYFCLT